MVARNFVLAFLLTGRPTWDGVHTTAFDGSAGTYRGNENFEVGSVCSCLDNQIYIEEGSFAVFFYVLRFAPTGSVRKFDVHARLYN